MSRLSFLVLVFVAIFLSIITSSTTAFPMDHPSSVNQKRCLIGRFVCVGATVRPVYHVSHVIPVAAPHRENIIVNNNNEIDIVAPKVAVPAIEHIEKETIPMIVTEMAPFTIVSSVTETDLATETLPAETVVMNNYVTMTDVETASFTESVFETQTLPAETVVVSNFVTYTELATESVTESVFATETLPAETYFVSNYVTMTEFETASVTESVFETQTLPAETVVMSDYFTVTELSTASVFESVTEYQTLPAETVVMNNYATVTAMETISVVQYETPAPVAIPVMVPAVAACHEACVETSVCATEVSPCS